MLRSTTSASPDMFGVKPFPMITCAYPCKLTSKRFRIICLLAHDAIQREVRTGRIPAYQVSCGGMYSRVTMYASLPKHALRSSRITDRVPTEPRVERAETRDKRQGHNRQRALTGRQNARYNRALGEAMVRARNEVFRNVDGCALNAKYHSWRRVCEAVSVKETSVCIVDGTGKIVREVKVASEPDTLLALHALLKTGLLKTRF
jgi:hypothetical protein